MPSEAAGLLLIAMDMRIRHEPDTTAHSAPPLIPRRDRPVLGYDFGPRRFRPTTHVTAADRRPRPPRTAPNTHVAEPEGLGLLGLSDV